MLNMKNSFFIRKKGEYIRINLDDILYIEGCRNYLKIITENSEHLVLVTFKRMEELLSESMFIRIHKSYIVSVDKINEFGSDSVKINGRILPIGHNYKGRLEKMITIVTEELVEKFEQSPVIYLNQNFLAV